MTAERPDSVALGDVGRSALILTGGAAAVQVLGIVRELFLAAQVGLSAEFDALLIALFLPTTLAAVVTSGMIRAVVPAYLEAKLGGLEDARRLAGTVMSWAAVAGLVLWVVLAVFAGAVISVTGPGLSPVGHEQAIDYLRLLAPVAFVTSVSAILLAVCQAEQRFVTIAVATLAGPAVTLATMLLLWGSMGLRGLAIASVVGPIVGLGVLALSAVHGSIVPIPTLRRDPQIRALVRHAAPLTLSAAILQVNVVGDRAIASLLGPGGVSALRYADVLVRVPLGAIGPAWASAIYPTLVQSTLGARASLAATVERTLRYVIALFVPVAALTAAVAPLAVAIAYGRGAFTVDDMSVTARAVACFAPLLVTLMLVPILTGAHNARRRGKLLLLGGCLNVTVNIVLDVVLGITFGVAGVALASSIAEAVVAALFVVRLVKSEDSFELAPVIRTLALAVLASALVGLPIAVVVWLGPLPSDPLWGTAGLIALGAAGLIGYFGAASLMGMEEPRSLVRFIHARLLPHGRRADR